MEHKTDNLVSNDGIRLFTKSWLIDESIADLILVHGYSEHSGRYQWVTKILNENKINVHSFDLRGHGQSEGERAYVSSFGQFLDDLHTFIEYLDLKDGRIFLFGHSLGGLIVTRYLIKHPDTKCNGVVLSSPALKVGDNISPILVKVSSIISALFPKLKTTRSDSQYLSRDPKVVEDYDNDPLVYHDGVKSRIGGEIVRTMLEVRKFYQDFKFPILIMQGSADKLVDPQGSQWMYNEILSEDKTLEVLPGLYHEILHEPEKEEIITKMIDWIKNRV